MEIKEITRDQLDIWLNDPVTKVHLQCLDWEWEKRREMAGEPNLIAESADHSHAMAFHHAGFMEGLKRAGDVEPSLGEENIFIRSGMLEEEDETDKGTD